MASSAALLLAVRGFLEVLCLHLKTFQTGEVILLSTAKLRSAVAGGSRAINLRHVIDFFDRRFWPIADEAIFTNIGRS